MCGKFHGRRHRNDRHINSHIFLWEIAFTFRPLQTYDWMRIIWNVIFARALGPQEHGGFLAKVDSEICFLCTFCILPEINDKHKYNKFLLISMQSKHCLHVDCRLCSIECIFSIYICQYYVCNMDRGFDILFLLCFSNLPWFHCLPHFCNVEMYILFACGAYFVVFTGNLSSPNELDLIL